MFATIAAICLLVPFIAASPAPDNKQDEIIGELGQYVTKSIHDLETIKGQIAVHRKEQNHMEEIAGNFTPLPPIKRPTPAPTRPTARTTALPRTTSKPTRKRPWLPNSDTQWKERKPSGDWSEDSWSPSSSSGVLTKVKDLPKNSWKRLTGNSPSVDWTSPAPFWLPLATSQRPQRAFQRLGHGGQENPEPEPETTTTESSFPFPWGRR